MLRFHPRLNIKRPVLFAIGLDIDLCFFNENFTLALRDWAWGHPFKLTPKDIFPLLIRHNERLIQFIVDSTTHVDTVCLCLTTLRQTVGCDLFNADKQLHIEDVFPHPASCFPYLPLFAKHLETCINTNRALLNKPPITVHCDSGLLADIFNGVPDGSTIHDALNANLPPEYVHKKAPFERGKILITVNNTHRLKLQYPDHFIHYASIDDDRNIPYPKGQAATSDDSDDDEPIAALNWLEHYYTIDPSAMPADLFSLYHYDGGEVTPFLKKPIIGKGLPNPHYALWLHRQARAAGYSEIQPSREIIIAPKLPSQKNTPRPLTARGVNFPLLKQIPPPSQEEQNPRTRDFGR